MVTRSPVTLGELILERELPCEQACYGSLCAVYSHSKLTTPVILVEVTFISSCCYTLTAHICLL